MGKRAIVLAVPVAKARQNEMQPARIVAREAAIAVRHASQVVRGREALHATDLLVRKRIEPLGGQFSQVDVSRHAIRVEAQGFVAAGDRLRQPSQLDERPGPVAVRHGVVGLEPHRLAVVRFRLLEPALLGQCDPQIIVGRSAAGPHLEHLLVMADRLRKAALVGERDPQVIVGIGMVRFAAQRLPKMARGLPQPARGQTGHPQVAVDVRIS